MKVFIADDEIFVIELLLHLIDWKALGLEVVGTAKDGVTALEQIKKSNPDIVITDIRMPGLSGLDLIKEIQAFNPAAAFVIISGHNNFEYAQTAIRFGVKDYILKPINQKDLTDILTNLTAELKKRQLHTTEIKQLSEQFDAAKLKMHNNFLEQVVKGTFKAEDSASVNNEFLLNLQPGIFQFLILKFDCRSFDEDVPFPTQLYDRVQANIVKYFESMCFETVYSANTAKYHVVLNYSPANSGKLQQSLQCFLDDMELICKKYSNLYFTICKGSAETDLSRLHISCENAQRAQRARILNRLDMIIEPPVLYNSGKDLNKIFPEEAKDSLKRNIEKFDLNEIRSQITQLFTLAEGICDGQAELIWALTERIYNLFLDITQNLGLFPDRSEEKNAFLSSLDNCMNVVSVRAALISRITDHINRYTALEDSADNTYITIAKKYIADHYMEKIALDDIAQLVFLNPVYFSILFKQEVGINFVDYLNKYRIEISKEYLKDISQSLAGIADLVGFTNAKYFSKIFKRIVGITPSQYRKKYMRHNQL
ncbi:response regulator transcription factor [Christensenella tenuis]|uniref:Stage 0 sporulation protein A homolog n=1 Tax=Christensenella tenuis TaxID=2763033 RepID=A0ABR7EI68_9FIRM|nr:response regulator [Christensenella tenuis]MBC5648814.1 response regulator [Christensenella tenuis]